MQVPFFPTVDLSFKIWLRLNELRAFTKRFPPSNQAAQLQEESEIESEDESDEEATHFSKKGFGGRVNHWILWGNGKVRDNRFIV